MRILYTADIHANPAHLDHMYRAVLAQNVDALVVGGDLAPHYLQRKAEVDMLQAQAKYLKTVFIPTIRRLKSQKDILIYLDMGNDDYAANRHILEDHHGRLIHLLHMQRHTLTDHMDIAGYMMVPPTPFYRKDWEKPDSTNRPYHPGNHVRLDGYLTKNKRIQKTILNIKTPDTIAADLEILSTLIEGPFIFVAHCPPYRTPLDMLYNGAHVGSLSIRRFIERWSALGLLKVALHGHIHEAPQISGTNHTYINNTICVNPGQSEIFHYVVLELHKENVSVSPLFP